MARHPISKGVFCLECDWWGDARRRYSMEYLLDLLDQMTPARCRHIHYDVSTREEFFFLLKKWRQKRYRSHPLLYLGFHGKPGMVMLGAGKRAPRVTLEEIGEALAGKCNGRVILFGSCETIRAVPWQRRKFLDATQALAICGYQREVDWMLSAAMDLIVLDAMQEFTFTLQGISATAERIRERSRGLGKALGFRIYTRQGEA
jgi:hypothetical protein